MQFHSNHPIDDLILGTLPLALIPFVKTTPEAMVVGGVVFSSMLYWGNKNEHTWKIDVSFACLFVALCIFKMPWVQWGFSKTCLVIFAVLCTMMYFYGRSYEQGNRGERQIISHLMFRGVAFLFFIYQ